MILPTGPFSLAPTLHQLFYAADGLHVVGDDSTNTNESAVAPIGPLPTQPTITLAVIDTGIPGLRPFLQITSRTDATDPAVTPWPIVTIPPALIGFRSGAALLGSIFDERV